MIDTGEVIKRIQGGNVEEIIDLIDKQPELLKQVFDVGTRRFTLLSPAVSRNEPELVKFLLRRGVQPIEDEDLISKALGAGRYEEPPSNDILKGLVDHGVEFAVKTERDCSMFIGHTLDKIFSHDLIDTFNLLLELGFDPVAVEDTARKSIITRALNNRYKQPSMIAEALLAQGCSANALEKDHESPLGKALEMCLYNLVTALLEKKADVAKLKNLPHMLAEHRGLPGKLCDRLLENQELSKTDAYGMTPIHMAVESNNAAYVTYLVDKGVDINTRCSSLGTPLLFAIENKHKGIISHLIDLHADLDAMNDKGQTALDVAQGIAGFKRICTLLTKAGAKTSLALSGNTDNVASSLDSINKAIQPGESWANAARETLGTLTPEPLALWHSLIRLCLDNNSAKPSQKWMKEADALVNAIDEKLFREYLLTWLPLVRDKRIEEISDDEDQYYYGNTDHVISENNTRLLKGLIWLARRYDDGEMSRVLRELATQMYKKVYGIGMRNAKLGNAAVYSLSVMPGTVGLKEIIVLRSATKYNPALVNINRVFDKLAEARGKTPEQLAELSVPTYGLTDIAEFRQNVGDFEAVATLTAVGKCQLRWERNDKTQASVPAAIKESHSEEIKTIKALVKDVQTACAAHCQRLEDMYLRSQPLDYGTWKDQYIDHRVVGFLARRLIWRVSAEGLINNVIFLQDRYLDHNGNSIEVPGMATVDLWHPSMSDSSEVLSWRQFLIHNGITQPFKQAHREIYLLTDAERKTKDHSLRFANHVLKQSQFHALATQRDWKQQRGGSWDGGQENSAYKQLAAFDLDICFDAEGAEALGNSYSGIYECVVTGAVSFARDKKVELKNIDPLVFSEVMRDVDLFVGVASIGNDPNWHDRENDYWLSASFGDLAQTADIRREVLTTIIPKLKIADQLEIDGRFLIVRGNLRTYKIHLGSSNILMAPDDSYLCIVQEKATSNVMLPFEGDQTLSLILSKAAMLAADEKIKDKSILSQIQRS